MLKEFSKCWSNLDNASFYKKMSLDVFIDHAEKSGVANGEDIEQIRDIIINSRSILEIGSGYGRVLKHIINIGFKGHLEAIDRNERYIDFCSKHYSNNVILNHADILYWKSKNKYDLVLLMWSGIAEFSKNEQIKLFKIFSNLLSEKGVLVIDKINSDQPKNDVSIDGQNWNVYGNESNESLYIPSEDEIVEYSQNFRYRRKINYHAGNNVPRVIYLFSLF